MKIHKYNLRLDNSICDIIRLKPNTPIMDINQKPITDSVLIAKLHSISGVLLSHIDDKVPFDERLVYVYFDKNKTDMVSELEWEFQKFNVNPKKLHDLMKNHGMKQNTYVVKLMNLDYDYPNIVKAEKLATPDKVYCLVKDWSHKYSEISNTINNPTNKDLEDFFGKIISHEKDQNRKILVKFPTIPNPQAFCVGELTLFQETE